MWEIDEIGRNPIESLVGQDCNPPALGRGSDGSLVNFMKSSERRRKVQGVGKGCGEPAESDRNSIELTVFQWARAGPMKYSEFKRCVRN